MRFVLIGLIIVAELFLSATLLSSAEISNPAQLNSDEIDIPSEWDSGARILQREFGLSDEVAFQRISTQGERLAFREEVAAQLGNTLGGFRFDHGTGVQTVLVTSRANSQAVVDNLADRHRVDVAVEVVTHSFDELRALADQISSDRNPIIGEVQRANPDVNTNTVEVYVPAARVAAIRARVADLHPAIRIFPEEPDDSVEDVRTTKTACGRPARGGIVVWHHNPANDECWLGYR